MLRLLSVRTNLYYLHLGARYFKIGVFNLHANVERVSIPKKHFIGVEWETRTFRRSVHDTFHYRNLFRLVSGTLAFVFTI